MNALASERTSSVFSFSFRLDCRCGCEEGCLMTQLYNAWGVRHHLLSRPCHLFSLHPATTSPTAEPLGHHVLNDHNSTLPPSSISSSASTTTATAASTSVLPHIWTWRTTNQDEVSPFSKAKNIRSLVRRSAAGRYGCRYVHRRKKDLPKKVNVNANISTIGTMAFLVSGSNYDTR